MPPDWACFCGLSLPDLLCTNIFFLLFVVSAFLPQSLLQFVFASATEQNEEVLPSLLREILWLNKYCIPPLSSYPSPTLIKRNWVFGGKFLICDVNRKDKHILLRPHSRACGICLKCYVTGKSLYPELNYLLFLPQMSWILNLMFVLLYVVFSPFLFLHENFRMSEKGIMSSILFFYFFI